MMKNYYHVSSRAPGPSEADSDWDALYGENYPCLHLHRPIPEKVVVEYFEKRWPLNFVTPVVIDYASEEFIACLGDAAEKYLKFGSLYFAGGKKIAGWRTFGANKRIPVRGTDSSIWHFCKACGHLCYTPGKPLYILQSDLSDQALYYATWGGGLVVNEYLFTVPDPYRTRTYVD